MMTTDSVQTASGTTVVHQLAAVALGPILLLQGLYVRRVVPRLPEASGSRQGITGQGEPLRLLIVGDSAAAGVGAATQAEALSGHVVAGLREVFQVQWELIAKSGETTVSTATRLAQLPRVPWDVVVTSLGVNDVTGTASLRTWMRLQADLVTFLRDAFSARYILLSGLPPMHRFPALPQPLRWYLGRRALNFDHALRTWAETQADCEHVPYDVPLDPALMATDGFHPGPPVYALWGSAMAQRIRQRWGGA